MASEPRLQLELQKARERIDELEGELKKADQQAAAHIRLMVSTVEIELALDNLLHRIATDGVGERYPLMKLIADLEVIRDTIRAAGEERGL